MRPLRGPVHGSKQAIQSSKEAVKGSKQAVKSGSKPGSSVQLQVHVASGSSALMQTLN